jgi:hypothetical protein
MKCSLVTGRPLGADGTGDRPPRRVVK